MSDPFATHWTVACQFPLSVRFPRQEEWSGFLFPSPGNLHTQGENPCLLHWQAEGQTIYITANIESKGDEERKHDEAAELNGVHLCEQVRVLTQPRENKHGLSQIMSRDESRIASGHPSSHFISNCHLVPSYPICLLFYVFPTNSDNFLCAYLNLFSTNVLSICDISNIKPDSRGTNIGKKIFSSLRKLQFKGEWMHK